MARLPHHRTFILSRYILGAHAGPFLFSVFTLMFLFLLQFIMRFIDQLVGKGLSAWVILELIVLNLSWMLVLAVPMSVLVSVLMAFGDLSSRNEITAMRAAGVSIYRMLLPVLVAGALVMLLMIWFNNYVLPESNYRLKTLTMDIRRKKPTISLVDGVFSQDIPGYSIQVRKTRQEVDLLEGVTLFDHTNPVRSITITAERGRFSFSPDFRKIIMNLEKGEIHELDLQERNMYRRIRFARHRLAMDVEGFDFERSAASAFTRGDRELSAMVMMSIVDSLRTVRSAVAADLASNAERDAAAMLEGRLVFPPGSAPGLAHEAADPALRRARQMAAEAATAQFRLDGLDRQINQYLVEVHKKYSIPAACIVFVLVGVPLGIMSRRGGFGIAATLSLGFFVLYWACLIGGEKLADRAILSPAIGMWIANVLIGLLGAFLVVRTAREAMVIHWSFFRKFIPQRWRAELPGEPVRQDERP